MPTHERATCPMCNGRLMRALHLLACQVVPEGLDEAPYAGLGEVARRSAPRIWRVSGRREVVQDLWIWRGEYRSPWQPFCDQVCAARFGSLAWREGVRLPAPVPEVRHLPDMPAPQVAERFGRLLEATTGAAQPARLARIEHLQPGDPGWHPVGKPPPVPGEFKYDRGGYRISDRPADVAARQARMRAAQMQRWPREPEPEVLPVWKVLGISESTWRRLNPAKQDRLRRKIAREAQARQEDWQRSLPRLNGHAHP